MMQFPQCQQGHCIEPHRPRGDRQEAKAIQQRRKRRAQGAAASVGCVSAWLDSL